MLVSRSLYADKLRMYYDWFAPEQLKVLLFDDLEADPRAFAGQAFDFLDLPLVERIDYGRQMSKLSRSRFPLSGPLSRMGANTLRRLGWVNLLGSLKSNPQFRALFYRPYESQRAASDRPDNAGTTARDLRAANRRAGKALGTRSLLVADVGPAYTL